MLRGCAGCRALLVAAADRLNEIYKGNILFITNPLRQNTDAVLIDKSLFRACTFLLSSSRASRG